jgi:hypothetical protein
MTQAMGQRTEEEYEANADSGFYPFFIDIVRLCDDGE